MTGDAGDARTEAERAVHQFDVLVRSGSTDAYPHGERLVAALAAAMRNHGAQAHHGLCESIGAEDEMVCDCGTAELREALSALRARAGKEKE